PTDPNGGYTINGFGWDLDNDGEVALWDEKDGEIYESEDGLFIHPRGYDPDKGGSSDYDYDDWHALDEDDLWGAGWYLSYWSYWVKDDYESDFGYSGWGASGRVLQDGSWDGWNFARNMISSSWKEFVAAPATIPNDAKTEFTVDGVCYRLTDFSTKAVAVAAPFEGVSAYSGSVDVPASFVDEGITYNVTAVGDHAFSNTPALTAVNLPQSVKKIGKYAFSLSAIERLTVDGAERYDNITAIGTGAFAHDGKLHEFVLPAKVTTVPDSCFYGVSSVAALSVPDHIEAIGRSAFDSCEGLRTIRIPATVRSLGMRAFYGCKSLSEVYVMNTTPLPIDGEVFQYASQASLTVPDGYDSVYAAAPGWSDFADYHTQTIPVSVGDIFKMNGMTYQVLSDSTVKATYCKVDGKPDRTKIIAANLAGYEGDIVIPGRVTYQKKEFAVVELNDSAFYGAGNLASVVIEAPVKKIGNHTFNDCGKLTSVTLPLTIESIGTYAFAYTAISSIVLPEGVTSLGERAFFQAKSLESVKVPSTVTTVGNNCFAYTTSLKSIEFGDNITSLGGTLFQNCTSLVSVKLPAGLTVIPASCFDKCSALTELTIPETVTTIRSSAFSGCSALDIKLPAGVTSIETSAFQNCLKLTEFTLPESMTTVPNSLFYGCVNLSRVTLGSKITSLGSSSFRNCTSLKRIEIPSTVSTIGTYCFAGSGLDSIALPDGLKTISSNLFDGCKSLTCVDIPSTVTTISSYAFQNSSLKRLEVPASVTTLNGSNILGNCPDAVVYMMNPKPVTAGAYTWRVSGSVFLPIVVPSGSAATYLSTGNNWKKSAVTEPVVTGVGISDVIAEYASGNSRSALMTVKGRLALTYDMADLPAMFEAVNSALVLSGLTPRVTVGDVVEDAVVDIESMTFTATMPACEAAFDASLSLSGSDVVYSSEPVTVDAPVRPSAVNSYVDFDKIEYTVGEGPLHGAVMISWNDEYRGVDHLVWGVDFAAGATPAEIIASVVKADSRLVEIEGGYAYDVVDKGEIKPEYDHHSADSADRAWHVYSDATPRNGSVVYLTYEAAVNTDVPAAPDYTFCIPAADRLGAWVPEGYRCPIADNMVFPIWARAGEYGYNHCSVTLNPSRPFIENDKGAITALKQDGYAMITLQLSPMEFPGPKNYEPECYDLTVSVSLWPRTAPEGQLTLDSGSRTRMSIVEPVRPISRINDKMVSVMGHLDSVPLSELVDYEPKDATYTQFIIVDESTGNRMDTYMGRDVDPFGAAPAGYDFWLNSLSIGVGGSASDAIFSVRPRFGGENVEGLLGFSVVSKPVSAVYLEGVDEDEIDLELHEILALIPAVEPADADNKAVKLTVENASAENIAVTYPVGGSRKFTELVTYFPGTFDLVLSSVETPEISRTYHVNVREFDVISTGDEYQDGTFWLNEEWFTHKDGSINYLTAPIPETSDEIVYRAYGRENDDCGFGATSQFAMIFADKLFVMSKQEHDGGDIRGNGGGRLVIADARSLKRLASFDEIGGDGRACVGVSAEKAYIGTNAGIRVLHMAADGSFSLEQSDIQGINNDTAGGSSSIGGNQALYNKQIGDMVCAGRYVFAIQQGVGVHIIDTTDDSVVRTVADAGVQGITQAADGNVWYASTADVPSSGTTLLHEIDLSSLEEVRSVNVPGTIGCSWGSWRSTSFFASKTENVLFWSGAASSVEASGATLYRWNTADDASEIVPLMTLPRIPGVTPDVTQVPYATMRYDDRVDAILMATTTAPSGNYRWNWYNFIDASSGDIINSVPLKPYYWFPALPVFPDKHAPEFSEISSVEIIVNGNGNDVVAQTIDLSGCVTDADNIDSNIRLALQCPDDLAEVAEVSLSDNRTLTVTPVRKGRSSFTLVAESNGRSASVNVPVVVDSTVGLDNAVTVGGNITVVGRRVILKGLAGVDFTVFDMAGRAVCGFRADSDDATIRLAIPSGAYLLSDSHGARSIKFVIR
ncbi:MAG: leucine-rich repeat protein, partial [Muribaculaceae bacterium]|nr:leucine-rich repeat protein [Muribaculaceae bacterium]